MQFEQIVKQHGQEHLMDYYERLNDGEKHKLENELAAIDWNMIALDQYRRSSDKKENISPISVMTQSAVTENRSRYEELGLEKLKNREVGVVILAGGQGSRLGFDGPKGALNVGKTKEVFIFQLLLEELAAVSAKAGAWVHLYIMTSEENNASTIFFLQRHWYFGYPSEYVHFFVQDKNPCVDLNGKLLMADERSIAFSPNGNGGWFHSLIKNGFLPHIHKEKIKWLNVVSVDNVLQKMADPIFIGAVCSENVNCGAKVVRKKNAKEKVGVLCYENGHPAIVEYYDMDEAMAEQTDENGELVYGYGVTLNYLFCVEALEKTDTSLLPVHLAKKRIPFMAKDGEFIEPKEENGYKFEYLVLDLIKPMQSCLPYEVEREKEFAPIKNSSGDDSVETAQQLLEMNGLAL